MAGEVGRRRAGNHGDHADGVVFRFAPQRGGDRVDGRLGGPVETRRLQAAGAGGDVDDVPSTPHARMARRAARDPTASASTLTSSISRHASGSPSASGPRNDTPALLTITSS